ncbi:(2Fe-2S) ferredoxin domain-containing protein [Candidatus Poribacteria bacterium]|nr:(2Fe-2S) ferredoxin domain-containing protein [Candidatus Poribacteria bacterium]
MKISDLKKIRDRAQKSLDLRSGPKEYRIVVSMGTSGIAAGARDVMKMLLNEIETQGLENVELTVTGSAGFDDAEPVITVEKSGEEKVIYGRLTPDVAKRVITEHIMHGRKIEQFIIGHLKH